MPVLADYLAWSGSTTYSHDNLADDPRLGENTFHSVLTIPSGLTDLGPNPLLMAMFVCRLWLDPPAIAGSGASMYAQPYPAADLFTGINGSAMAFVGPSDTTSNDQHRMAFMSIRSPGLADGSEVIVEVVLPNGAFFPDNPANPHYASHVDGLVVAAVFRDLEATVLTFFRSAGFSTQPPTDVGGDLPLLLTFDPAPYVGHIFYAADSQGGGTPPVVTMENAVGWEDAVTAESNGRRGLIGLYMSSDTSSLSTAFTGGVASGTYQVAATHATHRVAGVPQHFAQVIG